MGHEQDDREDQTPVTGMMEELKREREAARKSLEEAGDGADDLKQTVIVRVRSRPAPAPLPQFAPPSRK